MATVMRNSGRFVGYAFYMAEEWRVCLTFNDQPGVRKRSYYRTVVCDMLRSRLGDAITVSAGEVLIFLYAETADAAERAEHVAQEVVAQQSLVADSRLEQWDPSGPAWRDARTGTLDCAVPGLPVTQEDKPWKRRLGAAVDVLGDVVEGTLTNG